MKDVMLDIEAFGNGKHACLVQIAAVYFDRETGLIDEDKVFKMNVDARDSQREGAHIDADTVYWWLSQGKEAIASIIEKPQHCLRDVMFQLNRFLKGADQIWCHATYDFVIISEAYKALNIKPSFSFRTCRDMRTLMDLAGIDKNDTPREGVAHDALSDCIHQVTYCMKAFKALKR